MMANKAYVSIALAVWLISASFLGLSANALPNHVVAGGILGPGDDRSPGLANPANVAAVVFYSPSQPSYPLLAGVDSFTAANGVDPALFARDVGADWNWADGDEIVAIVETVRGVNGWTGVNHTSSLDALLNVGVTVQDLGDTTLEMLPALTLVAGADYVNATWTGLADVSGNVVSYEVYRDGTAVGTVPQGASPWLNDTGLGAGLYCYTLAVNYRRDQTGGVYETMGRSEAQCATLTGLPPRIVSTTPAAGEGDVAPAADVLVTFSESIDPPSLAWTINPAILLVPTMSAGNTVATFTHATPFADCADYQMEITAARDSDGNPLAPGPVPNPWTFTIFCPNPQILSTSPANGTTSVRRDASVTITFSKAMDTGSVTVTFAPTVANLGLTWSGADTILEVTHAPFSGGTEYRVDVSGQDTAGRSLLPGPADNPFFFTTNNLPTAVIDSASLVGVCRTGGFGLDITWTMDDLETVPQNLRVWLNYTYQTVENPISGMQDQTGMGPTVTFTWPTPALDGTVQILLTVMDEAGETWQDTSPDVRIDSTPPTVALTSPSVTTNVATDTAVIFTFSEAMNRTAAQGAVLFAPAVGAPSFAWSDGDTVLTITHAPFLAATQYTITVQTDAKDACSPGLGLTSDFTASFTTGAGPKAPNPPTNLRVTSETATGIAIAWDAPIRYTDGSSLPPAEIARYDVYRSTSSDESTASKIGQSTSTTFTDTDVAAGAQYYYWVRTIDTQNRESELSASVSARAGPGPTEGFNWLVVLLPLIVVLLLVGIILLMRRKRPAAPAPKPPEEAPLEEAPVEEAGEVEEALAEEVEEEREAFIPCPNCGTMVKPTDAECFVCGAKL